MSLRLPLLLAAAAVGGCAAPKSMTTPSLAPRAAETIDPRVPIAPAGPQRPVDPALAARLAVLVDEARRGDGAFRAALAEAERLTAAAGAPQSESWVVAQQALSVALAARGPTTRALGDIDSLAARALAARGGMAPADLAAIESAAAEVGAIDRRQAAAAAALSARLGG